MINVIRAAQVFMRDTSDTAPVLNVQPFILTPHALRSRITFSVPNGLEYSRKLVRDACGQPRIGAKLVSQILASVMQA